MKVNLHSVDKETMTLQVSNGRDEVFINLHPNDIDRVADIIREKMALYRKKENDKCEFDDCSGDICSF